MAKQESKRNTAFQLFPPEKQTRTQVLCHKSRLKRILTLYYVIIIEMTVLFLIKLLTPPQDTLQKNLLVFTIVTNENVIFYRNTKKAT